MFTSIILIHELGHIVVAIFFKWNIDRIILLPFGGITIFNECIDKSLIQELLIAIFGPLFQIIYYILFLKNSEFSNYNTAILLFNLLPIYPLDGSKIVNIILNRFISFKFSHILSICISYIVILLLIFNIKNFNMILLMILFFIFIGLVKECVKHKYYFNKFLLERYLYKNRYSRVKKIKKITQMKKQTTHIFQINNNYFTEKDIIRKTFDK